MTFIRLIERPMTDQEINKAIAEWCGWKIHPRETGLWLKDGRGVSRRLPNYTEDLNACHEAISKLTTWDEQKAYINELKWLALSEDFILAEEALWKLMSATARQRCEALLRTIGKWKE